MNSINNTIHIFFSFFCAFSHFSGFRCNKFKNNLVIKCIMGYDFDINYTELKKKPYLNYLIIKILLIIDSDLEIHRKVLSQNQELTFKFKTKSTYIDELKSVTLYSFTDSDKQLIINNVKSVDIILLK